MVGDPERWSRRANSRGRAGKSKLGSSSWWGKHSGCWCWWLTLLGGQPIGQLSRWSTHTPSDISCSLWSLTLTSAGAVRQLWEDAQLREMSQRCRQLHVGDCRWASAVTVYVYIAGVALGCQQNLGQSWFSSMELECKTRWVRGLLDAVKVVNLKDMGLGRHNVVCSLAGKTER